MSSTPYVRDTQVEVGLVKDKSDFVPVVFSWNSAGDAGNSCEAAGVEPALDDAVCEGMGPLGGEEVCSEFPLLISGQGWR